ncbi:hypothetical protein HBI56_092230 [Parastagonospora nodorum]|nr:hypothetical protein HBI10_133830 [Parastagonospora nodorum]KAH4029859.1 hypothetical protein HBI13_033770 [Parastagonospora nodorum]KAH4034099.1 hypothetical protein HBI09_106140 [Parastagonospora nodorum]KAH4214744.1 hypothetical protein HBI95_012430 [Parastagonospora nodorum]KAH4311472.1 hypothetical protein HBI01_011370 [Parastagonospora nodorum]
MSSQDSSPTTSIFDFDLASTSHLFTLASSHSTPSKNVPLTLTLTLTLTTTIIINHYHTIQSLDLVRFGFASRLDQRRRRMGQRRQQRVRHGADEHRVAANPELDRLSVDADGRRVTAAEDVLKE